MAWALEYPGCFAYAETADMALAAIPAAISEYSAWILSRNQGRSWIDSADIELVLEETWDVYFIDDEFELVTQGYEVNSWYRHDWKPLSAQDIERGIQVLEWSRSDLLDAVSDLTNDQLSAKFPKERWNIEGILRHVGNAEWWYLHQLGMVFPKEELPKDTFTRLEYVRAYLVEKIPTWAGSTQVVGVSGEFWSPRKVLRRTAWHERDHTWHIRKLLGAF